MIEQYIAMMKELKALGDKMLEADNTTGEEVWFDEVEIMGMHLEIGLEILTDVMGEDE